MITITQEQLKEYLSYCPDVGEFRWVKAAAACTRVGSVAGSVSGDGYYQIRLKGKNYKAHRLAWLYMKGSFPEIQIDHINRSRADNRFSNLREATPGQNQANAKNSRVTTTGIRGVCLIKGRYEARLRHDGHYYYLGSFDTALEAKEVYDNAAFAANGEFQISE
jgi:hypothetical protein